MAWGQVAMVGYKDRWSCGRWGQVATATLDLAVTPRPCQSGGSWALRLEVKNTRRTLVLSKVKCVTRQREEPKITRVYTQQIPGFPRLPSPGQSQESICGCKEDSQAKAPGHPKSCRGQGSSSPPLPCHVLKRLAAWTERLGETGSRSAGPSQTQNDPPCLCHGYSCWRRNAHTILADPFTLFQGGCSVLTAALWEDMKQAFYKHL